MPTKTDKSPPPQQDRARKVSRSPRDEVRNSETDVSEKSGNQDAGVSHADEQDINTHGSER